MKRKCVLGVLKTEEGLRIKEEMLGWLSDKYEVITVEQEAPGELYEYPAIRMAASIAAETYESVLYLHTKGAGNTNQLQPLVRQFWKHEFVDKINDYFAPCDKNRDFAVVSAPIVGKNCKVCWYNGFVLSPGAGKKLNRVLAIKKDRMWFEQGMLEQCEDLTVVGILRDDAECPEMAHDAFISTIQQRVGIMTIAKNESKYIREWLDYHYKLGVDEFFIIDNNDEGDDSLAKVIAPVANKYRIRSFDLRGRDALVKVGMQKGAYNQVVNMIQRVRIPIDWLAVIDIDEFLYFDGKNIKEFLYQDKFKDTDVIHINWRIYDDNDQIYYEDKPVQERFTRQAKLDVVYNDELPWTENCYVKSITKLRFRPMFIDTHTSYINNCVCKRSSGELTDCKIDHEPITSDNNYVKHYNCKSLQEYIEKRCINNTDVAHAESPSAEKRIRWYFNMNSDNTQKREFINAKLGI